MKPTLTSFTALIRTVPAVLLISGTSLFVGCSGDQVKVDDIAKNTDTQSEYARLDQEFQKAQTDQVDILAPKSYTKAWEHHQDAHKKIQSGDEASGVLHEIAESRAYLTKARDVAAITNAELGDIVPARKAAVAAGAGNYGKDWTKLDSEFRDYSNDAENGKVDIKPADRTKLFQAYRGIELRGLKDKYLGQAKKMRDDAVRDGAVELAPKSLATTNDKITTADNAVAANRENPGELARMGAEATAQATRLVDITKRSHLAKAQRPEDLVNATDEKESQINNLNQQKDQAIAVANAQTSELNQKTSQLSKLQAAKNFQDQLTAVQSTFTKDEAEVYREGDKILIRLKGLKFPSGKATLRDENFPLLGKVQQVIGTLQGSHVAVEGHTDSVGGQSKNMKLSEERANAVKSYLVANNTVPSANVSATGYGFEKPIAPNKTALGRAQNRRIDVLIDPPHVAE